MLFNTIFRWKYMMRNPRRKTCTSGAILNFQTWCCAGSNLRPDSPSTWQPFSTPATLICSSKLVWPTRSAPISCRHTAPPPVWHLCICTMLKWRRLSAGTRRWRFRSSRCATWCSVLSSKLVQIFHGTKFILGFVWGAKSGWRWPLTSSCLGRLKVCWQLVFRD